MFIKVLLPMLDKNGDGKISHFEIGNENLKEDSLTLDDIISLAKRIWPDADIREIVITPAKSTAGIRMTYEPFQLSHAGISLQKQLKERGDHFHPECKPGEIFLFNISDEECLHHYPFRTKRIGSRSFTATGEISADYQPVFVQGAELDELGIEVPDKAVKD